MSSLALRRSPVSALRAQIQATSRQQQARWATSTAEAAKEKAGQASSKAKEAASSASDRAAQVSETAKKYLGQAGQSLTKLTGSAGERASSALGAYREPLFYNAAVAREVLKQVYIAERLAPPSSVGEIRSAYETLFNRARDPQYWRSTIESGEWKRVAIYALEAIGIFTIGEMIGRRKLVGYGKIESHGH
ncbi:uncharacterized protein L969DRAFT_76648 [Mixia osmundae IAM 14324]|uniref:Uncharacterized protein n=1 Tax=Mixia osmundae (strain CBS 9802 / IAM 14324 / JCM 22182 / KY 12970) TaxID=764103 RepID=G7E7Q9_MIXOS|nr:uncharacterized protein L969DRAFT_76648 [Mixia osmundae IAM 14324]KEI38469.1 hypothetical protein L969DRAFT_76648 [Mixia osmundae IAM 14324]GAA98869.1 hypothetical protein E5Q_05557 [Mixia osmundae IAM 14324]